MDLNEQNFEILDRSFSHFFIGHRTLEDCKLFIEDVMARVKTKPLFTSDELSHYQTTPANKFSYFEEQAKTGKRGRSRIPKRVVDPDLQQHITIFQRHTAV